MNVMKTIFLSSFIICLTLTTSAQDWLNRVFRKSFEVVQEKSKKEWYKGQIVKKQRNGMGLLKMKDGSLYIGDFSQGNISGYGMLLSSDGEYVLNCDSCTVYIGNWRDGKKAGVGTCYARNGDVIYTGKFMDDRPTGLYPSTDDYSSKYFSLLKADNGDMFLGELKENSFNGFCVTVWANGDLYIGNSKGGMRKGIGLYLMYNGEWETLNFSGENYTVISSSERYRNVDAAHKQTNRQLWGEVLGSFSNAALSATELAGSIKTIKHGNSSVESVGTVAQGTSSSGKSSSKAGHSASAGTALNADRNTYSKWETQLVQMRTYPERYPNYASEYKSISAKMQQIRAKWQARGYTITKSPYEGNLQ